MKKLVLALIACSVLSGCSSSTLRMIADGSQPMAFAPVVGGIFSVTGLVATIASDVAAKEELQAYNESAQAINPELADNIGKTPHVQFENMSTVKRRLQERRLAEPQ